MQIGAIFPQTEIGSDPGAIREYAQAAEQLGYSHLFIADHVLGASSDHHAHVAGGYYTHQAIIHESFTTMGYLAAITQRIGLTTGILILPQRATALVAKQAAAVDVLSNGRLRLGIGVGWNHVEYEALNRNFRDRGRRSEEQIALMRELWTKEVVDFHGQWHRVDNAGINPLPVQRPIPVWLGAGSSASPLPPEPVLRRIATISDGWFPNFDPQEPGRQAIATLREYVRASGRDESAVGIEGRIRIDGKQPENWVDEAKGWQELGAVSITVEARRGGLEGVEQHIDAIVRFREALTDLGDWQALA
ncbi:MAG: LLM class F420-dependent oxidoreductase [Chloroflexota bacterium]|nr:LLM class F420-dependent oxidoreductase [Chloroflexota bacterium]